MERGGFPRQRLPFYKKNKEWRKSVIDWADNRSLLHSTTIRKSFLNKRINYDLVDGKLHMEDMKKILDPYDNQAISIPEDIQNYPVIISPLNVLIGEESKRRFDFKVVITNPNAITEKEKAKSEAIKQSLVEMFKETAEDEEAFNKKLEEVSDYFEYDWQDAREMRANYLLQHYIKELEIKRKFNTGFKDLLIVGEEAIMCDIDAGDLVVEKLNPKRLYILQHGRSTAIEDADLIIYEDYVSRGKAVDSYFSELKEKDLKKLEDRLHTSSTDQMDNIDETKSFVSKNDMLDAEGNVINDFLFMAAVDGYDTNGYFDSNGNIRRLRVWWKSSRKIKKVTSYDEEGNKVVDYYPETYEIDKTRGEEEEIYWVNEAWEGVKLGKDIYVNMRPKKVQYNRLNNPSKCHFGIIGEILSTSGGKAVSLVDRMKPYHYLYLAIKDRLNKLIETNYGKIFRLDLARIPAGWDVKKWLHFIRQDKIAIEDSFKEGTKGQSTGKMVGNLQNNPGNQAIDMELGNSIQQHVELLNFIREEMDRISGVTRQRQGEISNRETVGGVERSVMQSSHITEEYFSVHDSVKKRVLECMIETAKIALRENPKKLQAIADDYSIKLMEVGGDEFAEADYGIVVDNDNSNIALEQKLESVALAAMQTQVLSFSTILDIYTSQSISYIKRKIGKDERERMQQQQENLEADREVKAQSDQILQEMEQARLEVQERANIRDNETKLAIGLGVDNSMENEERAAKIQTMLEKLELEKQKLEEAKRKNRADEEIKRQAAKRRPTNTSK